jgi:hypothetical protein
MTCGGKYLVDFYPEVLTQLEGRYPTYTIVKRVNYQNATRIGIQPPAGEKVNHIELDCPPGCYKIWCRICHGKNEETNIVMTTVACDDRACINLLLNSVETCAKNLIHPAFDRIVNDGNFQVDAEIVPFAKAMMYVGYQNKAALVQQLNERILEAQDKVDTDLEARVNAILTIIDTLPDCQ